MLGHFIAQDSPIIRCVKVLLYPIIHVFHFKQFENDNAEKWIGEFSINFIIYNEKYISLFIGFIIWLSKKIKSDLNNQKIHKKLEEMS